jgi:hypothetical protein
MRRQEGWSECAPPLETSANQTVPQPVVKSARFRDLPNSSRGGGERAVSGHRIQKGKGKGKIGREGVGSRASASNALTALGCPSLAALW